MYTVVKGDHLFLSVTLYAGGNVVIIGRLAVKYTTNKLTLPPGFPQTLVSIKYNVIFFIFSFIYDVGRLSSPSAAKNTDTRALLEHR